MADRRVHHRRLGSSKSPASNSPISRRSAERRPPKGEPWQGHWLTDLDPWLPGIYLQFPLGFVHVPLQAKVQAGSPFSVVGCSSKRKLVFATSGLQAAPWDRPAFQNLTFFFFFPRHVTGQIHAAIGMTRTLQTFSTTSWHPPFLAPCPSCCRISWPRAGFYQQMRKASIPFSFQRVHGLVPSALKTSKFQSLRRPLVVAHMCPR